MAKPVSLTRDISPPPTRKASTADIQTTKQASNLDESSHDASLAPKLAISANAEPTLAAIEAGQAQIRDHLEYFAKHLGSVIRPSAGPRLSIDNFQALYERNQHPSGHHFVVHQHDHPISGTAATTTVPETPG